MEGSLKKFQNYQIIKLKVKEHRINIESEIIKHNILK